MSCPGPIDARLGLVVVYTRRQLRIASQVVKVNVNVTVSIIENQFSLNNLRLPWSIDGGLGF